MLDDGEAQAGEARSGDRSGSPPRVLIVDNDQHVAVVMRAWLEDEGFEVETVVDGAFVMDRVTNGRFDLLVCDLCMPRVGGEEVLRWMAEEGCSVPTFVVSGFLDEAKQGEVEQYPFVLGILRKPFDLQAFARAARAALEPPQKGGRSS